jgi:thiamine biosynthesis protein ThiS
MSMDIEIQVNGERRTAPTNVTIEGLLRELNVRPEHVAIELNLEVVERTDYQRRTLQAGDRLEIISFIGGGQHRD